jgi:hypothetical protein
MPPGMTICPVASIVDAPFRDADVGGLGARGENGGAAGDDRVEHAALP